MRFQAKASGWLAPLVNLSNNWLSLTGVVLVTTAAILWLFLLPASFRSSTDNPYLNIFTVLILPAIFFGGLVLIPLGQYLRFRRERREGGYSNRMALDLTNPNLRRLLLFLFVTSIANVIIGGHLTYQGVHHMESVSFCGTTCHSVMKPEYVAYQNAPHSRVECVKCHVGPGATFALRAKIDGLRQVWGVLVNDHSRPIPVPVHTMRPARDTCGTCHWPQKLASNRLRIIDKYTDDEKNTRTRTVLLMRMGGGVSGPDMHSGIHGAHLGPGIAIRYAHAGEARQTIPWIEYDNAKTGRKVQYQTAGSASEAIRNMPTRTMDCIDCHNRPAHTFELPERAVDRAMLEGAIDPSLPFAKKQSLEILKTNYASEAEAAAKIPAAWEQFYKSQQPDAFARKRSAVSSSGEALLTIWKQNIFPEMKVTWGTYPNNIGHNDFPGCFRCHDEKNVSLADAKVKMSQDCNSCHYLLAMDEADPKVLSDLGITEAQPAAPSGAGGP